MSKKRRVFHIARELNLSNEAVIDFLGKLDKTISTQMSAVPDGLYEEICRNFSTDAVVAEPEDFRQKLKERKMLEELRRNKARMELEERIKFATQLAEDRPRRLKKDKEIELRKQEEIEARRERKEHGALRQAPEVEEQERAELSVVDIISKAKKEIDKKKKAEAEKDKGKKPAKKVSEPEEVVAKKAGKDEKKAGKKKFREEQVEVEASVAETEAALKDETAELSGAKDKDRVDKDDKKAKPAEGKGKRKKKRKKTKISEAEITASIRQTLAAMEDVKPKRRRRKAKDTEEEELATDNRLLKVAEFVSAAELADLMGVEPTEVITACLELGMMVSINQRLDVDSIIAVADEFGYDVDIVHEYGADFVDDLDEVDLDGGGAVPRPPVVTIMGHVDHGKTSLLDYIRKSNIIAGEAGGITQHIGAYVVTVNDREITFLDTPGHEAFTAMRARGAQVTDLVVLIVAADDGVQPQTIEAINHATAANVPIVVAINKVDKPNANVQKVLQQLSDQKVLIEEWGGKYQSAQISAKSGEGVDKLLDMILLEADVLELKSNPGIRARGVIIESRLDKGKGPVATVLVQHGTLKVGDLFISGQFSGKVRLMYNERNQKVKTAPPSTPIQVVGFEGVPQAGDAFVVMPTEREVREISAKRQQLKREQEFRRKRHITLDQISQKIKHGEVKELNLIIKADVDGSIEALTDALMRLSTDEVAVNVVHKGVGGISESDVLLASVSEAIILGFQIRPTLQARELAERESVDIRLYKVIYDGVEDVRSALEGLLEPEITEEITGTVEVRETFKVPKIGTIAGCYVLSGKVMRNDLTKIFREDKLLNESKVGSLKRFKDDVKEVSAGFECGLGLEGFDDVKAGDIIEAYKEVKTARKL